jgi:hypothetical protein
MRIRKKRQKNQSPKDKVDETVRQCTEIERIDRRAA